MYATIDDMLMRFGEGELVDLAPSDADDSPADYDAERITAALDDASSEADTYLATRYPMPVADPPRMLVNVVCDIARYRLSGGNTLDTDPVTRRYEEALRWLRDVAKGVANIPLPPPEVETGVDIYPGIRLWGVAAIEEDNKEPSWIAL